MRVKRYRDPECEENHRETCKECGRSILNEMATRIIFNGEKPLHLCDECAIELRNKLVLQLPLYVCV